MFQKFSGGFDAPNDRCDKFFDLMNQMTPEVDGVSVDDRYVFFIQIWFTTHNRLLILDNCEAVSFSCKINTILQDSHLGKELLKKEQVKKSDGQH